MGTGAFIYASNYAKYGIFGTGLMGPFNFVFYILLKAIRESRYRCKNLSWVKPKNSIWFKIDGSVRWSSLVPLLVHIVTNMGYNISMTYAWTFARQANLNQGVITTLLSLSSVINAVTFYFGFGEKLRWLHLAGVILMLIGIAFIGAAAASNDDESEKELDTGGRSTTLNGILALTIGFCGPICIST